MNVDIVSVGTLRLSLSSWAIRAKRLCNPELGSHFKSGYLELEVEFLRLKISKFLDFHLNLREPSGSVLPFLTVEACPLSSGAILQYFLANLGNIVSSAYNLIGCRATVCQNRLGLDMPQLSESALRRCGASGSRPRGG